MVSQNVNKIFEAVQALTDAEKDELQRLIETRTKPHADLVTGLQPTPTKPSDAERQRHRRREFQPIELPGGPLSDDIIRDRR